MVIYVSYTSPPYYSHFLPLAPASMALNNIIGDQFCKDSLYGTGCNDPTCILQHDVFICELCVVVCAPASNFKSHEGGQRHRENLDKTAPIRSTSWTLKKCPVCRFNVHMDEWLQHPNTEEHQKHQKLANLKADYQKSKVDRQGITVLRADSPGVHFGLVTQAEAANGIEEVFVCTNHSNPVLIVGRTVHSIVNQASQYVSYIFIHEREVVITLPQSFSLSSDTGTVLALVPGTPLAFKVRFCHTEPGRYEAQLELKFQGALGEPFLIARPLLVVVDGSSKSGIQRAVATDQATGVIRTQGGHPPISPGRTHSNVQRTKWTRDLPQFTIPQALQEMLKSHPLKDILNPLRETYFTEPLSLKNYKSYFQHLLWIEELQTRYVFC